MAAPTLQYPYQKIMEDPPLIGVIGGSGLYKLDNLTVVKTIEVTTPWGAPSSPITIASLPATEAASKPILIAFISRHSPNHSIPPSSVPARANIAALKHLGVKAVLAFSAVGSLREEVKPGDLVVPSQIIDRTKGIRPSTFFDGDHVAHAMFGEPFDTTLSNFILPKITAAIESFESAEEKPTLHHDRTLVVMEGPQFSTRAESNMYRQWGGDIINMSTIPEAKLAREAELSYALVCTSTDYDAWRVGFAPVTVNEVMKTLHTNALVSKHITATILSAVHEALVAGKLDGAEGGMKFSMVTGRENTTKEERQKLEYILPAYFAEGAQH